MFFFIFLLVWAGLHVYIITRLLSVPLIAQHIPAPAIIAVVAFLATSYILSRVMEHYAVGIGISHVLEHIGAYWVGIFFLLFTAFLCVDVVFGFGAWLRPELPVARSWALLAAGILILISLVQARQTPVVTEYSVSMPNLPASADGTVLVVASDMHLGSMLGREWALKRVAQFDALKPELILLVGDIFEGDESTHADWLPVLKRICAPRGVYFVTGNHELYAGPDKIINLLREAGFKVLRDTSVEPVPGLVISGVDDLAFRGRKEHGDAVMRTLESRPPGSTVFLSHTPVQAERAAELGVNLMLSGHTHDGQIWPFRYLVRMAFRLVAGRYDVNGMTAIVGRGTGTWGPRMRLWKRSELLKITLRAG